MNRTPYRIHFTLMNENQNDFPVPFLLSTIKDHLHECLSQPLIHAFPPRHHQVCLLEPIIQRWLDRRRTDGDQLFVEVTPLNEVSKLEKNDFFLP